MSNLNTKFISIEKIKEEILRLIEDVSINKTTYFVLKQNEKIAVICPVDKNSQVILEEENEKLIDNFLKE